MKSLMKSFPEKFLDNLALKLGALMSRFEVLVLHFSPNLNLRPDYEIGVSSVENKIERSRMLKWPRSIGMGITLIAIIACNQMDKLTSKPVEHREGTGMARMKLPSLPKGFIPDSTLDPVGQAYFQLTISGNDMDPIYQSWMLYAGQTGPVTISGIPVGYDRVFTGRLLWMSSKTGDTAVTHEGATKANIYRDSIADVVLYLQKKSGGSANICIEVEGWQNDSACIRPPPPPFEGNVGGCWSIWVNDYSGPNDSGFYGSLNISQYDSSLLGVVTWQSGGTDSASGTFWPDMGLVKFGQSGHWGTFYLKAYLDSSRYILRGEYQDANRGISGGLIGYRTQCDSIIEPPPPPPDTIKRCFLVGQAIKGGKTSRGRMVLQTTGERLTGGLTWDGFDPMFIYGNSWGSVQDSTVFEMKGMAPKGMLDAKKKILDSLYYRATVYDSTGTFSGPLYQIKSDQIIEIGVWKGASRACTEMELQ
jgi:hypothetical protein